MEILEYEQKDLYVPYINENGRKVRCNAALLHQIKGCGGIEGYNKKVATSAITTMVENRMLSINENLLDSIKKDLFKKVG